MGLVAEWDISVDSTRSLILITLKGFFVATDIQAFSDQLSRQLRKLRCKANEHMTIVDIAAMKIQPQESVAMFARIVGDDRYRSKRLAFVYGATLARMQARRLTDRDGVKFFENYTDAERWILGE